MLWQRPIGTTKAAILGIALATLPDCNGPCSRPQGNNSCANSASCLLAPKRPVLFCQSGGEMKFDLGRDLYEACEKNELTRAREVLAASSPSCLQWTSLGGWTPLHVACEVSSVELVKCLLSAGSDVNAKFASSDPPIQVAIHSMFDEHGNRSVRYESGIEVIKLLLEAGADIHVHGSNLCSSEGLARLYDDVELSDLLRGARKPASIDSNRT